MRFLKSRFFVSAFLSYFLLLGMLVSIFGTVLIQQRREDAKQLNIQETQATVDQLVQIIDDKFDTIVLTANQISNSSWMPYVSSKSDVLFSIVKPSQKWEICEEIAQHNNLLQIGNNVAFVFPNRNLVVDSIGFWDDEQWMDMMNLDEDLIDQINDKYPSFYSTLLLSAQTAPNNDEGFVIAKKMKNESLAKGIFLMQVDGDKFQNYLAMYLPEALSFSIVQDDQVIYAASQLELPENTTELVVPSNVYNWNYVITVETNVTTGIVSFAQMIVIGFCAVAMICVLAYVLARVTQFPILRLINQYDKEPNKQQYGLDRLECVFQELNLEKEKMEILAKQYLNVGQNIFFSNLLEGTYDKKNVVKHIQQFKLGFSQDLVYIVAIFESILLKNKEAVLEDLINLEAFFAQKENVSTIHYQEESNSYVLIIGSKKECEESFCQREKLAVLLDEHMAASDADVYIGESHDGIEGIHLSYREAYTQITQMSAQSEQLFYYYPSAIELKINSQLRMENFEMVEQLLQHLENENRKRQVLIDVERRLIHILFELLVRFALEKGISEKHWQEAYWHISKLPDIADLWGSLHAVLTDIRHMIREDNFTSVKRMQIVSYVNEHYRSSNLSLMVIAEAFGMSRSAVSKIFKETTQSNFVDYVCTLRVEYAKQLISAGQNSVSCLSKECGYETEISFRRAFQKQEGVTPSEYIKQHRH